MPSVRSISHSPNTPCHNNRSILTHAQAFFKDTDVSGADTGYPYDREFTKGVLDQIAYRRFEDQGTLYGIDGHAFVVLTFGEFGYNYIIGDHLPKQYRRMYLIGLYYQSVFHKFSRTIAKLAEERLVLGPDKDDFKDSERADLFNRVHHLRARFLGFANALWFEEVTSQMQGIDMFERLTKRLGVRALYEEVQAELERFDAIEADFSERRSARRRAILSFWGGLVGGTLIVYEVVGICHAIWSGGKELGGYAALGGLLFATVCGFLAALATRSIVGNGDGTGKN